MEKDQRTDGWLSNSCKVLNQINGAQYGCKSISDSIFLHCNAENPIEFLRVLKNIYISFVENKTLIRGGVAYNKHFENPNITYSLALSEAYT